MTDLPNEHAYYSGQAGTYEEEFKGLGVLRLLAGKSRQYRVAGALVDDVWAGMVLALVVVHEKQAYLSSFQLAGHASAGHRLGTGRLPDMTVLQVSATFCNLLVTLAETPAEVKMFLFSLGVWRH